MFRTLSARLFAVLMIGLGTIQIVSFFAFMVFRGGEIKEQMMRFLGADVSFAYDLMRSVPPEQRPDWLSRLNQGFHTVSRSSRHNGACRTQLEATSVSPA